MPNLYFKKKKSKKLKNFKSLKNVFLKIFAQKLVFFIRHRMSMFLSHVDLETTSKIGHFVIKWLFEESFFIRFLLTDFHVFCILLDVFSLD